MGLIEQYNLRRDETLMRRFIAATENAASDAIGEADTVDNHVVRLKVAREILASEKIAQQLFVRYLQLPAAVNNGGTITDAQLQTIVNVVFTRYADAQAKV